MRDSQVRVGIVVNPKHARSRRAYSRLVPTLRRERIRYRSISTTRASAGAEQARALVAWGADLVIVLGGDGTLRAIAPVLAAADVPTMVIPTGTANVLARHVGVGSVRYAVEVSIGAVSTFDELRTVDVAVNEVDVLNADGHRQRSHFLSMAGIGGDARAVGGHGSGPGLLGYVRGGARALLAPTTTMTIDGQTSEVWSVMASKVSHPAGPIPVFPSAEVVRDDFEFLTVDVGEPGNRLGDWARIAIDGLSRRHADNPDLHYWTAPEATIRLETPAPAHLDGDLIGDCREMRIRAGTLRLTIVLATSGAAKCRRARG